MRGLFGSLALLLAALLLASACGAPASSSGSSSGGARCLDRGSSGGHGARTASEQPDRPLFFLFCVESP